VGTGLPPERLDELVGCLERLISLARTIDFELLASRREAVAQLMVEVRFFGAVSDDLDPFETSAPVIAAMRERRGLPAVDKGPSTPRKPRPE
jgi:hypothetical protein